MVDWGFLVDLQDISHRHCPAFTVMIVIKERVSALVWAVILPVREAEVDSICANSCIMVSAISLMGTSSRMLISRTPALFSSVIPYRGWPAYVASGNNMFLTAHSGWRE